MSNPFVPRHSGIPRDLIRGESTTNVIKELWDFYQFMLTDEEVANRFKQWKTYDLLKRDNNENR